MYVYAKIRWIHIPPVRIEDEIIVVKQTFLTNKKEKKKRKNNKKVKIKKQNGDGRMKSRQI